MELFPQLFGVQTGFTHGGQSVDNNGLVLLVGDAVPLVGAGQQADSCLAFFQQLAHNCGQEVLTLQGIGLGGIVQESRETGPCFVQVALVEPHMFMETMVSESRSVQVAPSSSV